MAKGASILLYRSTTPGATPAAANLAAGEMAANAADATLFMKDTGGTVQQIGGKAPTFPGTVTTPKVAGLPFTPSTANLVSFWNMEEATSATRLDSFGTNNLADTNGCTQVAGKLSNAVHMAAASSQILSVASNSTIQAGNVDFTLAAWCKLDTQPAGSMLVLSKFAGGSTGEYTLGWNGSAANQFTFGVGNNSASFKTLAAASFAGPSTGTWYFLCAWFVAATGTLNIQVNNGAIDSTTAGFTPAVGTSALKVGSLWDGSIDAVGIWKRTLTANERAALYNAGTGIQYPFPNPNTFEAQTGSGAIAGALDSQGNASVQALTAAGAAALQSTLALGSAAQTTTNASGLATKYNGDTLAGNGLGAIVATATRTAQTATITATTLWTPPADGLYEVSLYLVCTTAGSAGTVLATLSWTDDAKAQTLATATASLASLGSLQQAAWAIRARTTAAIQYSTTVSGATGSPQYALFIAVKRLT